MDDDYIITFFLELVQRNDIAIILISVDVANRIQSTINKYKRSIIPNILVIPSKDHPFNIDEDEVLLLASVSSIFINY